MGREIFKIRRGWGGRQRVLLVACLMFLLVPFAMRVDAAQVTLAWDPSTSIPLSGYKVYYGFASQTYTFHVDAGTATVFTVTGLNETSTYYFAVTAYSGTNNESAFSAEVSWVATDTDADGMADAWEVLYFSGTQATNGLDTFDADGDGVCNLDEFILGSNPIVTEDFADVDISFAGSQCVVSFTANAATGTGYINKQRYYTLERCNDLAVGTWSPATGYVAILATNQTIVCSEALSAGASLRTRTWLQ
ncbi:MAG: fibronectin type III domain-containing protein [bacterium]